MGVHAVFEDAHGIRGAPGGMFHPLVKQLSEALPGFGKHLAMDSKAVVSFAKRKNKNETPDGRREGLVFADSGPSDPHGDRICLFSLAGCSDRASGLGTGQGLAPDNLDGYQNDTGFPLAAGDQRRFNRWIAKEVRRRGLAVGLKNDLEQAEALAPDFDWILVESCILEGWWALTRPFREAG
ncbi:MAG: endo alpha-1,4 polygalactosaminidase [Hydrogenibacillus schlegelii]|nr:endo alpha-1,4 polygalactosaminidase [Hydrogenibacillus schlegelii]